MKASEDCLRKLCFNCSDWQRLLLVSFHCHTFITDMLFTYLLRVNLTQLTPTVAILVQL